RSASWAPVASPRADDTAARSSMTIIFFFKQKTAYDIGLGIPAEPLFRSGQEAASGGIQGDVLATDNNTVGMGDAGIKSAIQGSNVPNPDEAVPSFVSGAMAKAGKGLLEG